VTQQQATERNALAAQLAQRMVVAHASPGGSLATQVVQWQHQGLDVQVLEPA